MTTGRGETTDTMASTSHYLSAAILLCTLHLLVAAASLPNSPAASIGEQQKPGNTKEKRTQEVIMFGNQQNKPAGMIDDALAAGYFPSAEKKDDDGHDYEADDSKGVGDESTDGGKSEQDDSSTEEPKANFVKSENIQVGGDITQKEDSLTAGDQTEKNYHDYQKGFKYGFGTNAASKQKENAVLKSKLYGYPAPWNEYLNFRSGFTRRRRNIPAPRVSMTRSVRSTVEELLRSRRNGRFKRDLELDREDLLALLALLAEQKMNNLPPRANNFRPMNDYEDYGEDEEAGTPEVDEDNDYDDLQNLPYVNPVQRFRLSRRSDNYHYPPMDYRYLIPGQKRSVFRQRGWQEEKDEPGQWGGILETKRYLPERKRQETSSARDVYSLAQLLRATQRVDPTVPLYRRPVL